MSGEIREYNYHNREGELLYRGHTYPAEYEKTVRDVIGQLKENTELGSEIHIHVHQLAPVQNEGQTRAIAAEVARESQRDYTGLWVVIAAGVFITVIICIFVVACQNTPVMIQPPSNKPNCHFLC